MLPDAFPQLIDTLLRLPHLEAGQLRELIQHLPDPQASAREMMRRGWITPDQFSSLFSGPKQRPTAQETLLVGFGDDAVPPDADCDNWDLPVSDEEDKADVAPEVECARPDRPEEEMLPEPVTVEAVSVPSGAGSTTPQFEWDMLVPAGVAGNEARARESDTDRRLKQWKGWATKGLLVWILFQGSFFAGRQFFGTARAVPPVARQEATKGKKTRVPTDKRRVRSRPMMAAKAANKVPNNQVAADHSARAVDLPAQPAPAPAQVMLPAQEAPQQAPARTQPAVWNGPFMFPAQGGPLQFQTPLNPQQYQQMVRQQLQRHQQKMQRQQQQLQRRQQRVHRHPRQTLSVQR